MPENVTFERIPVMRRFVVAWLILFIPALALAYPLGLAPAGVEQVGDAIMARLTGQDNGNQGAAVAALGAPISVEVPRIIIPSQGIDAPIVSPSSADIPALNEALGQGAARYPGSAAPSEHGTVFLFGHSTGLRMIHNPAYATFNDLGAIEPGELIRIRWGNREYWYRATSIRTVAAADAAIDIRPTPGVRTLVLSTCNVFGSVEERIVIEAAYERNFILRSPSLIAS
ncbi:sortase [Candidatus Parcubacteria bacterium]|nr:MAG: sortase [Candidatus Parcubacteria bacterium]